MRPAIRKGDAVENSGPCIHCHRPAWYLCRERGAVVARLCDLHKGLKYYSWTMEAARVIADKEETPSRDALVFLLRALGGNV